MTKITIFSGFLGAGKTTLIKKLLADGYNGEKLLLIENEFGEIGIDGGFMKDAGIEVTEMNSGCICCSLVGDFGKALKKVLDEYHPDRILIEPSGVGKLSDVIGAVQKLDSEDVELAGFVTVADAKKAKMYLKNFGEFYTNQVANASAIILSRTDGMSEERLEETTALLRTLNENAPIVTTPWDILAGKQIIDAMEQKNSLKAALEEAEHELEHEHHHHHHDDDDEDEDEHEHECCCGHDHDEHEHHDGCCCGHDHEHEHEHHHEHHHDENGVCSCGHHHDHDDHDEHDHHHHDHDADEIFQSFGAETARKTTADEIEKWLTALDTGDFGAVLRAKGILPAADDTWLHFDYVPDEHNVRTGTPEVTGRLCVIGSALDDNKLKTLFGMA
ncbi:MAG: cobalamin biosynthesis protein CobW [Clostridia bacterium]|nr:cobalamin biosynthesis protein CobW [Clostridia bacterium]